MESKLMYCVETFEYENGSVGQKLESEWFDTLDEAKDYADRANDDSIRGVIIETTGDPDDEGKVIFDF